MNVLISACLLGLACRYDGQSKTYSAVEALRKEADIHLIPFCPEQGGGLATPRDPAERQGDAVRTQSGRDVTKQYRRGAAMALELAKTFGCMTAVLKESCVLRRRRIYDGTFTRRRRGDGGRRNYEETRNYCRWRKPERFADYINKGEFPRVCITNAAFLVSLEHISDPASYCDI